MHLGLIGTPALAVACRHHYHQHCCSRGQAEAAEVANIGLFHWIFGSIFVHI